MGSTRARNHDLSRYSSKYIFNNTIMATQSPSIQEVLDDIIQVALPNTDGEPSSYLNEPVSATGTSLTFADNSGFVDNNYIILGDVGGETTEIVKIDAAVSAGTAVTTTACVFSHGYGTKVTLIRYNQVRIYGSSTSDDTSPSDYTSALIDLDVSNGNNVHRVPTADVEDYYYARYYDEDATAYSPYSDSVAATGLTANSRGEMKQEFLSIYNEQMDDLVTPDWLDRAINRWQRELSKRRKYWSVLKSVQITDLVEDTQGYALPTGIQDKSRDSIISVKIYNEPELTNIDQADLNALTYDNVGTTVSTEAALGGTSLVLSDSSDISQQDGTVYCKGVKIGYTLNTESTGTLSGITTCKAITAFADAGSGVTTVTAASHGLSDGDTAYIGSTRNYDGMYTVSGVAGADFNISKTYVADDAKGAVSKYDDVITETLEVGDEVWQTRTVGQPVKYMVDTETFKIKLWPIPDSTFDGKNMVVEYWKKFVDLTNDADTTLFNWPENCYLFLNWQLAVRRRLGTDEILARRAEWMNDLENLVVDDPDYREIRITPRNMYNQPY